MKKGMILALFAVICTMMFASNKTAIDYYDSGDLKSAKALFLATSNLDAMDYYYLGQIALNEKKNTDATNYFNKGLQLDPANLYNSVGLATLQMATDPKGADKALKTVAGNGLYKKDPHMLIAIAEAYYANNNTAMMDQYVAKAKKANKKSPLPYIFEGNVIAAKGNSGDAAARYENAVYFDPNSKVALVKLAQLYVSTRKAVAFEYLDKATTLDPNYEYGWKTQANLRYRNGFYPEAKTAQEKYMSLIKPSPDDFQTYGEILYFNKDYPAALNALAKANDNTVTNRLKMFSMYDQGKFTEALPLAEKLVSSAPKAELLWQDYSYYADMLNKTKKFTEAAKYYELAYQADTTRAGALKSVADAFNAAGDYPNAIKYLQHAMDKNATSISMADVYSLGAAYYDAGTDTVATKDKIQRMNYLKKADETFAKMSELFPEHYLGYMSRARTNSQLDPETKLGLAKPYYEKALEIMLPNQADYKNQILEIYQYLGILYLQTDNYPQSKVYWLKVLEIDPNNAIAKKVIDSIDSSKKK